MADIISVFKMAGKYFSIDKLWKILQDEREDLYSCTVHCTVYSVQCTFAKGLPNC